MRPKNPLKASFRNFGKQTRNEIREIKKIAGPAERLARYEALDQKLRGLYKGGKPGAVKLGAVGKGAGIGTSAGLTAGGIIAIIIVLATAPGAMVLAFAIMGAGGLSGAVGGAGLGGFLGGRWDRKKIRSEYGSIRKARAVYRLQKTVEKKIEKEAETIYARDRAAQLQQKFDAAAGKKSSAPAVTTAPAAVNKPAQPAS